MAADFPPFALIAGNRDVVSALEHALEEARAGRLQGVVICGLSNGSSGFHWAIKDDEPFPWARLVAAVTDAQHALIAEGI